MVKLGIIYAKAVACVLIVSYSLGSCFHTVKGLLHSEEMQTNDLSTVVVKKLSIVSGSVNY